MATLDIIGGSIYERDPKIDCQRTINMYVVDSPSGKNPSALVPMPGIRHAFKLDSGAAVRNSYVFKEYMYFVVSTYVYRCDSLLNRVLLGVINTSTGIVNISNNNTQVFFVDGVNAWVWDTTTSTFSQVTSVGLPTSPEACACFDGYFIVNSSGTNQFTISSEGNGLIWDALDFVNVPDTIVGFAVFHRRLYVFGKVITQVWYDAGASDFPFRLDENINMEYGCAALGSIAIGGTDEDKKLFWLSNDSDGVGSVMMTSGMMPQRISKDIDYALQQLTNRSDATGFVYREDGHVFYELSFTTDNKTFVYDVTTNKWFERQYQGGGRYIAGCHSFFNGKHYVGHYAQPIMYTMSSDYLDDDDVIAVRTRICRHLADVNYKKVRIARLQLDLTEGRDLSAWQKSLNVANYLLENSYELLLETGGYILLEHLEGIDEVNPDIFLSSSKDGGVWFGTKDRIPTGNLGNRLHRTIWRRLGSARDWVFKIELANRRKIFILGASVDVKVSGR